MASLDIVKTGKLKGSLTALQMPSIACDLVKIKALTGNSGKVYVGPSTSDAPLTKPTQGDDDTTSGWELAAGEETGWIPVSNLNAFYRICEVEGDRLVYLALRSKVS